MEVRKSHKAKRGGKFLKENAIRLLFGLLRFMNMITPLPLFIMTRLDHGELELSEAVDIIDIEKVKTLQTEFPMSLTLEFYNRGLDSLVSRMNRFWELASAIGTELIFVPTMLMALAIGYILYPIEWAVVYTIVSIVSIIFGTFFCIFSVVPVFKEKTQLKTVLFYAVVLLCATIPLTFTRSINNDHIQLPHTSLNVLQFISILPGLQFKYNVALTVFLLILHCFERGIPVIFGTPFFRIENPVSALFLCSAIIYLIWKYMHEYISRKSFSNNLQLLIDKKKQEFINDQQDYLLKLSMPTRFNSMKKIQLLESKNKLSQYHEEAIVMFIEMLYISKIAENEGPSIAFNIYSDTIEQLDGIISSVKGVEKIKTFGASYLAVAGLNLYEEREDDLESEDDEEKSVAPVNPLVFCDSILKAALIIRQMFDQDVDLVRSGAKFRIGIAYGPVQWGVLGYSGYTLDVWSETVNMAARLCTFGDEGDIALSSGIKDLLGEKIESEERTGVLLKGFTGEKEVYLLKGMHGFVSPRLLFRVNSPYLSNHTSVETLSEVSTARSSQRSGRHSRRSKNSGIRSSRIMFSKNKDEEKGKYILNMYSSGREGTSATTELEEEDVLLLKKIGKEIPDDLKLVPLLLSFRSWALHKEFTQVIRKDYRRILYLQFILILVYVALIDVFLVWEAYEFSEPLVRIVYLAVWLFVVTLPLLACLSLFIVYYAPRSNLMTVYYLVYGCAMLAWASLTQVIFFPGSANYHYTPYTYVLKAVLGESFYADQADTKLHMMTSLIIVILAPLLYSLAISSVAASAFLAVLAVVLNVVTVVPGAIGKFMEYQAIYRLVFFQLILMVFSYIVLKNMRGSFLSNRTIDRRVEDMKKSNDRTEQMLKAIIPAEIWNSPDDARKGFGTVIVADMVGFTEISRKIEASELVRLLNTLFRVFDEVLARHEGVKKLHTDGDAYMAVAGYFQTGSREKTILSDDDVISSFQCAQDMIMSLEEMSEMTWRTPDGVYIPFEAKVRIGISKSFLIGGLTGTTSLCFNLFGTAMDDAFNLQYSGDPSTIVVSKGVYNSLGMALQQNFEQYGNRSYICRVE